MIKQNIPRENHRPATNHWQTLSHNVISSTPRHERERHWLHNSCYSNYHTCSIKYRNQTIHNCKSPHVMLFDSLIENSNLLIDLQRIVWNKLNFILKLVFFFDVSHGPSWLYGSWNNNYYAISDFLDIWKIPYNALFHTKVQWREIYRWVLSICYFIWKCNSNQYQFSTKTYC
jgi:hypothetical protein